MKRLCYPCAFLLALPPFGQSQQPAASTETVIKLNVQAMPAPKPALRYQLLPELREMNPGNPVQEFMKCVVGWNLSQKERMEQREKWETMALKDLPVDRLRAYEESFMNQANYAARLDTPDWQTLSRLKIEGIDLNVHEVSAMRGVASVLRVRFRSEIVDRRFDDALVTAKTMFALARLLGDHPTLIGDLVGIALTNQMIERVEEMLQQPGCPNLFWALTDLPQPFIDLRKGIQGERVWDVTIFDRLDDKKPMSEAHLQEVMTPLEKLFKAAYGKEKRQDMPVWINQWIAGRTKDKDYLQAARKRLIEFGRPENAVKQFPDLQVILLDGKLRYETSRDEAMKGAALPYWQAQPLLTNLPKDKDDPFLGFVPAVDRAIMAQARLDQRLALLRCVEALRIYAADHNGKLPAQLADIKLPLPVDPVTGQAFQYKLDGGTAHLRGTPPQGMEKNASYNIRVEVSIRNASKS